MKHVQIHSQIRISVNTYRRWRDVVVFFDFNYQYRGNLVMAIDWILHLILFNILEIKHHPSSKFYASWKRNNFSLVVNKNQMEYSTRDQWGQYTMYRCRSCAQPVTIHSHWIALCLLLLLLLLFNNANVSARISYTKILPFI